MFFILSLLEEKDIGLMKKNPGVPKDFAEAGQIFNMISRTIQPRSCWAPQHPAQ